MVSPQQNRHVFGQIYGFLASRLGASSEFGSLVKQADAARDQKDWKIAADFYQKAVQLRPHKIDIWVQLGNMTKEAKQFQRSRVAYETALKLDPLKSDTHLQMGHLLKLSGDLTGAQASYKRAAELDPGNTHAVSEMKTVDAGAVLRAPRKRRSGSRPLSLNAKAIRVRAEIEALLQTSHGGASSFERGATALQLAQPALAQAMTALDTLLAGLAGSQAVGHQSCADIGLEAGTDPELVFDVSDLIQYFRHHRLPTGIQRVQIEVISLALLQMRGSRIRICCFTETGDYWREVPPSDFVTLCELSLLDNDWTAPDWRDAMEALEATMAEGDDFVFGTGAFLVNIGTSWWLQNYFLHVREAKKRSGIFYVPFVHDMIPIMTPEFCVDGLVQDFISWAQGVYFHADYFLVNSEATRRDLQRVGSALGYSVPDELIRTITLDADYRKAPGARAPSADYLSSHRLTSGRYVLFVSTIEARKNHIAVFDAWLRLCKIHGEDAVPRLVCVGSRGWLNDAIFAKLSASDTLRKRVLILSGVPDDELAQLYKNCLFSVYPSFYEGWGLPVTESLSYGKTALLARSSSLPEAGGHFADYFTLGDEADLCAKLERLMFDANYRNAREAMIRDDFKPRTWGAIASGMTDAIREWKAAGQPRRSSSPAMVPGRYYALARNAEIRVHEGMQIGEIFRVGNNWWGPDAAGCWLKQGAGELELLIETPGSYRLYIGLAALPEINTPYDVTVLGGRQKRGAIKAGDTKWVGFLLDAHEPSQTFRVVIEGYAAARLKPREDLDPITVSLGVIGLMLCDVDDFATRGRFAEALALDELADLARGNNPGVVFAPTVMPPAAESSDNEARA